MCFSKNCILSVVSSVLPKVILKAVVLVVACLTSWLGDVILFEAMWIEGRTRDTDAVAFSGFCLHSLDELGLLN